MDIGRAPLPSWGPQQTEGGGCSTRDLTSGRPLDPTAAASRVHLGLRLPHNVHRLDSAWSSLWLFLLSLPPTTQTCLEEKHAGASQSCKHGVPLPQREPCGHVCLGLLGRQILGSRAGGEIGLRSRPRERDSRRAQKNQLRGGPDKGTSLYPAWGLPQQPLPESTVVAKVTGGSVPTMDIRVSAGAPSAGRTWLCSSRGSFLAVWPFPKDVQPLAAAGTWPQGTRQRLPSPCSSPVSNTTHRREAARRTPLHKDREVSRAHTPVTADLGKTRGQSFPPR